METFAKVELKNMHLISAYSCNEKKLIAYMIGYKITTSVRLLKKQLFSHCELTVFLLLTYCYYCFLNDFTSFLMYAVSRWHITFLIFWSICFRVYYMDIECTIYIVMVVVASNIRVHYMKFSTWSLQVIIVAIYIQLFSSLTLYTAVTQFTYGKLRYCCVKS